MTKIITLTTDFGERDGYPAIMKGVIWGITPDAQIADLTHEIGPQNILEGALTLGRAAPFFPADTVHIAVVDPGVGTERRAIAARLGNTFFTGPDNGLITCLLEKAELEQAPIEIVQLDRPEAWLEKVSAVFQGRDIFAPVGARLAAGTALEELGTPIADAVRITILVPKKTETGFEGVIRHVDRFGNLSTNIPREILPADTGSMTIQCGKETVRGLVNTYGEGDPGSLKAIIDSAGMLSLCVTNGSAAERLKARAGDRVIVEL